MSVCAYSLINPTFKSYLYVLYYITVSGLLCCNAFWHSIL